MNIFKFILLAVGTTLLCSHAFSGNNVYKWKDKDGTIHYSQNAPQGQETQVITTKTPRAPLPDLSNTNNTPSKTTKEESSTDEKTEDEAPTVTKDQGTCDKAEEAIIVLQRPVVSQDGKVLTIDEKNEQLKQMYEIKKIHCP